MTLSLSKLQQYAKTLNTKVIDGAYKIADDHKSAVFVLESGPKLTMTEKDIDAAIAEATHAADLEQATEDLKAAKPKAPKAAKAPKPKESTNG